MPAGNASGDLSGLAYVDRNANGSRDPGDFLLPGIVVTLTGTTVQGRAVNVTLSSDDQGRFAFQNLQPGSYRLSYDAGAAFLGGPGDSAFPLAGGQDVSQDLGFAGLAAEFVTLRQFLSSSTADDLPLLPGGSGTTAVNSRPNNRPILMTAIPTILGHRNGSDVIDLAGHFSDPDITNSAVLFQTTAGNILVELFDRQAPRTVANFLNYVQQDRYDGTIFHRLVSNFVLQGGGFSFEAGNPSRLDPITTDPPVQNEFGTSNTEGTLALAKLGGDPSSGTSQFFFNLADNSSNLDNQNGGFTVFGKVATSIDMAVLRNLAGRTIVDGSGGDPNSPFTNVPMNNYTGTNFPDDTNASHFNFVNNITITRRTESLTYSVVGNSNPSLVVPTITNNRLTLQYANGEGEATITVRATDQFGASVDTSFRVVVSNAAPTVSVALSPGVPETDSVLTATATATDLDGDPVTLTYVWKVNDSVVKTTTTSATTDSLDLGQAGNGDKGDVITVEVTAHDGTVASATASTSATVADAPARVTLQPLSPDPVRTDDTLTASVTAFDPDGDPFTLTYVWKVNGTIVRTTADTTNLTDSLDLSAAGNGDAGQQVSVEVTPNGGSTVSASITVANSAPQNSGIADQTFSGPGAWMFDFSDRFSDPDGQTLTYSATLDDANESPLPSWLNLVATGSLTGNPPASAEGALSIKVKATDPAGLFTTATFQLTLSNTPTSLNDAPTAASVILTPDPADTNDTLTATAMANDADGDPVTLTFVWKLNNTVVKTTTTSAVTDTLDLTQIGTVQAGDTVSVEVTPSDGTASGAPVSDSVILA